MFNSYNPRATATYQRINIETSMHTIDKHQIVSLLLDGLMESIGTARGALVRKDVSAKCAAVSKALRILQEGLSTGLDKVDGGELAANLEALYDYCINRLILANARNDDVIFQEVQRLIEPVLQGWKGMYPPSKAAPAATEPAVTAATVAHTGFGSAQHRSMNAYADFSLAGA